MASTGKCVAHLPKTKEGQEWLQVNNFATPLKKIIIRHRFHVSRKSNFYRSLFNKNAIVRFTVLFFLNLIWMLWLTSAVFFFSPTLRSKTIYGWSIKSAMVNMYLQKNTFWRTVKFSALLNLHWILYQDSNPFLLHSFLKSAIPKTEEKGWREAKLCGKLTPWILGFHGLGPRVMGSILNRYPVWTSIQWFYFC